MPTRGGQARSSRRRDGSSGLVLSSSIAARGCSPGRHRVMMTLEDRQDCQDERGQVTGRGNRGVAAPHAHRQVGDHAVVMGAGMAGLVAARVLADHFLRVTVIDRDHLPAGPTPRAGVPQSRHVHILLARGMALLDQLFPGLEDELLAAGAVPIDFPGDALWLSPAGWSQRFRPGLRLVSCTRPLLERSVRRRLAASATVRFLEGQEATGLTADDTTTAVTGVRLQTRPHPPAAAAADLVLPAALVIDASGRSSRTTEWLGELGYPAPPETTINPFLGYATRTYARPKDATGDWQLLYVQAKPPQMGRMGLLLPVEGDRWMVGLAGAGRDYPPIDEAGFLQFAASLRSPIIHDAIRHARPLSPIHGYRQTDNRWRHYEQAQRFPERLIVLGDAACTFNPIYGQGLTMAALAGVTLQRCLQAHFHTQALPATWPAWPAAPTGPWPTPPRPSGYWPPGKTFAIRPPKAPDQPCAPGSCTATSTASARWPPLTARLMPPSWRSPTSSAPLPPCFTPASCCPPCEAQPPHGAHRQ